VNRKCYASPIRLYALIMQGTLRDGFAIARSAASVARELATGTSVAITVTWQC